MIGVKYSVAELKYLAKRNVFSLFLKERERETERDRDRQPD